jgi:hypothetical protein
MEDITDPDLGMPRDLNGNQMIDVVSVEDSYRILPVTVYVEWQGVTMHEVVKLQAILQKRTGR